MQIERPDWFTPPETVYWDEVTGYAINLPFVLQGPPFWWKTDPQTATRIQPLRVEMGITVDDFADGEPEFTSSRPPPRPPQERGRTKRRPPTPAPKDDQLPVESPKVSTSPGNPLPSAISDRPLPGGGGSAQNFRRHRKGAFRSSARRPLRECRT